MQKTLYTLSTATYKCGVRSGNESIRTGGILINRELNITNILFYKCQWYIATGSCTVSTGYATQYIMKESFLYQTPVYG